MRVILLLIVTASVCLGQTTWRSAMLRSVSTVAAPAASGSNLWYSATVDADYYTASTGSALNAQKIKNTDASQRTIKTVRIKMQNSAGGTVTAYAQVWTSVSTSGVGTSQIGGNSANKTITNGTTEFMTFDWSTNSPAIPANTDFWIAIVPVTANLLARVDTAGGYQSTTYYFQNGGTTRTGVDMCFEIYVE